MKYLITPLTPVRLVVAAAIFMQLFIPARPAAARNSFWISSRDKNACIVSAVVQYNPRLEAQVRQENGISNAILQMDIHTKEPQELCNLLMMRQKDESWRPLLCVTQIRGNIYSGYLILPEEFRLSLPIEIRLGDRSVEANFLP
ncbi:MAG: hypothetical protein JSV00_07155 [bacterium]|nr:MAG: hypothetical protein JSV00_07155 [bacterium]